MAFWWLDRRVKWAGLGVTRSQAFSLSTNLVHLLLPEFADVSTDHRIHLLPSTPSVAVQPYRYSQVLKDEIEKQCDDMLHQGIIRPSTSSFSIPILFRNKDKTWRFCIEYRALDTKTVKDKFLIAIVDELWVEYYSHGSTDGEKA
jgi:hypothetical protein